MKMMPSVSPILPEVVPRGYRLGVDGWSFPKEKLEEELEDGTRKLLTLDISICPDEFVRRVNQGNISDLSKRVDQFYPMICPHNCPECFEKGDVKNYLLDFDSVKQYVEQALDLGLESVKFLGPGELLANPDVFEILDYFQHRDIKIGIFTKGDMLGDDELARKYQNIDSEQFAEKICRYKVTRILIDCRTFDEAKANKLAHSTLKNYARARNRAIELLVKNRMNVDMCCQRMSLQTNPVTRDNIGDVFDIFKWGAERNIPVCITPTMVSGRGRHFVRSAQNLEFQEGLIQLYFDIYSYVIKRGIMTCEQLRTEGVSSYAGTAPCNQLSCGMFIRKDGVVFRCPGNDRDEYIIAKDIRERSLKEIWTQSSNYALGPLFNNRCVKDGYSIPTGLYDEVLKRILSPFDKACQTP